MHAQDALLAAGTLVAAGGAGVLVALALRARRSARAEPDMPIEFELVPAATPVPVADMDAVAFTPVEEEARGPMPLPPILRQGRSAPPPAPEPIPTEWARRQVGPAPPGRTKGACSGCGAMLSVSAARPLRIACPVCGRTRLLA